MLAACFTVMVRKQAMVALLSVALLSVALLSVALLSGALLSVGLLCMHGWHAAALTPSA